MVNNEKNHKRLDKVQLKGNHKAFRSLSEDVEEMGRTLQPIWDAIHAVIAAHPGKSREEVIVLINQIDPMSLPESARKWLPEVIEYFYPMQDSQNNSLSSDHKDDEGVN